MAFIAEYAIKVPVWHGIRISDERKLPKKFLLIFRFIEDVWLAVWTDGSCHVMFISINLQFNIVPERRFGKLFHGSLYFFFYILYRVRHLTFFFSTIAYFVNGNDAPKTSHCLVRIFFQRHNWAIFLRKGARRGGYSQWRFMFTKI